jgi:hypothetical protein
MDYFRMKTFDDLTIDEKREIRKKAREWYENHKAHVQAIYSKSRHVGIAPCGSDMFRPELWKGIHWRWFKNEFAHFERPAIISTRPKEKDFRPQMWFAIGFTFGAFWLWFMWRIHGV